MSRRRPSARSTGKTVGVSIDVAQLAGVGSRSLQVSPPSPLRFMTTGPAPWPFG